MRYRPFGHSGIALSALGLRLSCEDMRKNFAHAEKLIMTALECGINTYHFDGIDVGFMNKAAAVLTLVERRLLFVSVSPDVPGQPGDLGGYTMPALKENLRGAIKDTGLQWIDMLLFGQPGVNYIQPNAFTFLQDLRRARMVRYIGASAETEEMKALIDSQGFNVIQTSFDIDAAWDKRHMIDHAIHSDMCVIGADYFPDAYRKASDVIPAKAKRGWFGGKAKDPLAGAGTHAFLHLTPDWTPEELCLGYALSLPSLSCILITPETPDKLEMLAQVPERHLPSSVPAQIEMARFTEHLPKSVRQ